MTSREELEAQLEATRRQLDDLTAEVARNEEKMRRTQRRELQLLQAETLDSLIVALTTGLRVSYGVEYVSVVLCDADYDVRHLLLANGTPMSALPRLASTTAYVSIIPQARRFIDGSQDIIG